MVRHNNLIPCGHFHKKWQPRVKTWFDQPMQKMRRKALRAKKLTQLAPKPIQLLRPMVHSPSVRYNSKLRAGRGFTAQELKQAGMNGHYARTIGIAVDYRRRNRCVESLARNVQRLKEYRAKLILFPGKSKVVTEVDSGKNLNRVKVKAPGVQVREVLEAEKKFEAFATLRRARCDAKYAGVRAKKKLASSEAFDGSKA